MTPEYCVFVVKSLNSVYKVFYIDILFTSSVYYYEYIFVIREPLRCTKSNSKDYGLNWISLPKLIILDLYRTVHGITI